MAETVAQKRAKIMRERMASAKARATSPGDDAAIEKTVTSSPPEPVAKATQDTPAAAASPSKPANKPRPYKRPTQPSNIGSKFTGRPGPMGGERVTYQRHVLFALVAAFLIKLVASGKALPSK
jgi:uncharacterized membrane protein